MAVGGRSIRRNLAKSGFKISDVTVSRKMRRAGPFARSLKTDAHVSMSAIAASSIFGTFDGTHGEGLRLIELVSGVMEDIYINNGVVSGGAFATQPWAALEPGTVSAKGKNKTMLDTGELIRVVRGGGLVADRYIEKGSINYTISWPDDPHPEGNGLSVADVAAIHEFGAQGKNFTIPPRPWLSRAMLAVAGDLYDDTTAAIDDSIFNASRALEAVRMFQK